MTMEPSGQRTGCEDDLTAWLSSGRCPSLESLDPRAGADKTLTPGLHCVVPAAPTPVISGHVGQQTIKSPTEVSGPPTLGGSGSPRYIHTCRPTYPGASPEVTTAQEGQSLTLPHPYLLLLVRGPLSGVPCPPAPPIPAGGQQGGVECFRGLIGVNAPCGLSPPAFGTLVPGGWGTRGRGHKDIRSVTTGPMAAGGLGASSSVMGTSTQPPSSIQLTPLSLPASELRPHRLPPSFPPPPTPRIS